MRRRPALPETEVVVPESSGATELDVDLDRVIGALDALDEGAVVVDEQGNEVMRNRAAERYRDARHGDALAQHAIERLLVEARDGKAGDQEMALFGPPREVLQLNAVPLRNADGDIVGAAAFVHDVTEARRVESIRRDFVANVSHELKTPVGALALLAETITSSDDPEVTAQLASRMVKEAERLGRIVDDLLDLSQIEAQEAPTRERVPVRVLLDEAADRLGPMALAHGIPLRTAEVHDDFVVVCDPSQIVSAVTNLLDNAVKYSEPGGSVDLGVERVDDRVVISVKDQGVGIPASDLERVFERFYRVDRARSRATGGTGLGLSIVRHIAQVHGGEITIDSVEGEGSTFRIFLPLADADNDAPARSPRQEVS